MRDNNHSDDPADARIDFGQVAGVVLRKLPRILVVTLVLCGLAYAVLLFTPRLYESTATLLVEPRASVYTTTMLDAGTSQLLVDDAQMASQIELIRSRPILLAVIEELDLRNVPEFAGGGGGLLSFFSGPSGEASLEDTINALRDKLSVTRQRDSRLLSIAVRSEDPELAPRIANAIAMQHILSRTSQQLSDTATAGLWLEEEINRLRTLVSDAESRVAEFRVANDLYVGANNASISDQQLSTYSSQIAAAAERRGAAQSRAEMIDRMIANGESVVSLPDVQTSPVIQSLTQELSRLQGLRAERSSTLLPNHPQMIAIEQQIGALNSQIANEARRVAASFQAQAAIEADLEQSLREELTRATGVAGAATRQGVTLAELEREAAAQRELLNSYLLRYTDAVSRTQSGSALPDVRLVSEAAPTSSPASPQTMLILVAIALVSLVFQVAAVIFSELLSGRAVTVDERGMRFAERRPNAAFAEDDVMPIAPLVADPAPQDAVLGPLAATAIIGAAAAQPPYWSVLAPGAANGAADSYAAPDADWDEDEHLSNVPEIDESPEPAEADAADIGREGFAMTQQGRVSETMARVGAASPAVIAAMPAGYGVFSPEFLGHGYPVAPVARTARPAIAETIADDEGDVVFEDILADAHEADAYDAAQSRAEAVTQLQDAVMQDRAERDIGEPQATPDIDEDDDHDPEDDDEFAAVEADDMPPLRSALPGWSRHEAAHSALDADIDHLAASMLTGGTRILVVAAVNGWEDSCIVAEMVGERLLAAGLSVVEIDAASGKPGRELGLSDLSGSEADFGDVVHRGERAGFSYVPWGQVAQIERRSRRVATLVEAISDVYEFVIVATGRVGMASMIGMFTELGADCALVTDENGVHAAVLEDLSELDFADLHVVSLSEPRSEVA